jgi:ABC-type transport system involved in Fe-S cluster assembly, ATPase component
MQAPQEVPGVTNSDFLKTAVEAHKEVKEELFKIFEFIKNYDQAISDLKMASDVPERYLNDGFSGGEKKRNEILQMKMIQPKIAILDEIDSGLDVDALKIVGENVTEMQGENLGMILITHYQRMLSYIKATTIHVMMKGKIVKSGGPELMERIDSEGYDWIKEELGIDDERVITEENEPTFLETDSLASALEK